LHFILVIFSSKIAFAYEMALINTHTKVLHLFRQIYFAQVTADSMRQLRKRGRQTTQDLAITSATRARLAPQLAVLLL
jgi:sulfur relay (sulfurtransferase) DsrC/TusE family protein